MKYNLDDSVLHPDFGGGVVINRFMSASGVNEIYIVDFGDNCIKRLFGSELSLLNPPPPRSEEGAISLYSN